MIDDAFFSSLLTYLKTEQLLARYENARNERGALCSYDQRALEAERVRNLAVLAHAWNCAVSTKAPT